MMGWTYTNKPKGQSVREFFEGEMCGDRHRILDCAVVNLSEAYVAMEVKPVEGADAKTMVFALVCMIRFSRDAYYNFGYKDMTETMGPGISNCPDRILDLLSPVHEVAPVGSDGYKWAMEWRSSCRSRNEKRRQYAAIPDGHWVLFKEPIEFIDGSKERLFKVEKSKRGRRYRCYNGYGLYRLRKSVFLYGEYEVIVPEKVTREFWEEVRGW